MKGKIGLKEWHWNYLWLSLYAIGVGAFLIGMPKYVDDLNFLSPLEPWFEQQGITDPTGGGDLWRYGIPWKELGEAYKDHWVHDNFRLVNVIGIPLLLLPKWVGSSLCVFAWMYAIVGAFRLVGISVGRSPLVIPGLLLLTYTLPWDDDMGSLVFHLNYLVPTAINIWLIRRLLIQKGSDVRMGRAISTGIVGLLAGLCHEGFAGPTLVGIVALIVLFRECRRKDYYLAGGGLILGILLLAMVPGTRTRVSDVTGFLSGEIMGMVSQFISWRWGWWICLGAIGLCLWKGVLMRMARQPLFDFLVVSIITGLLIALPVVYWLRAVWWSNFLITFLTLNLLRNAFPELTARYNRFTAIMAVVCLIVLYGNQVSVGYCAVRLGLQNRDMLEHFKENPDEPYYGEVYLISDLPAVAGYQPDYRYSYNSHWMAGRYLQYSEDETAGRFRIVPKELEYVNDSLSRLVSGPGGVREYKGRYYVSQDSLPLFAGAGMMEMNLEKGFVQVPVLLNRFRSKGDGKRYVWIIPKLNWWLTHTREIESIGKLTEIHPRWGWK